MILNYPVLDLGRGGQGGKRLPWIPDDFAHGGNQQFQWSNKAEWWTIAGITVFEQNNGLDLDARTCVTNLWPTFS